ncbi:cytoplasmic protein NCK1-like [Mesocricetus auratus]|uniref:Cytoplasmic protein NCK1-like n=1 Tax=Mesocricetus auratus TaxID=10036 RepID=A0ABM2X205_MESAU|nr:cytoplasmic protein NCK1-like [Mesocricetus auratus]
MSSDPLWAKSEVEQIGPLKMWMRRPETVVATECQPARAPCCCGAVVLHHRQRLEYASLSEAMLVYILLPSAALLHHVLSMCYNGQIGWFPSNYVTEEGDSPLGNHVGSLSEKLAAVVHNLNIGQVLHVVQALYPFGSSNDGELNFEKGDVMDVIEKLENNPEWCKCRKINGMVGLIPKNYVTIMQNNPLTSGLEPSPPQCDYIRPSLTGKFAGNPWYYGKVTRHQAETALNERGNEGDFLIRDSESSTNDFSVSLKAQGKNKHFKVQLKETVYCIGQREFSTMEELVEHYKKAPIFTSEQGEKLYLVKHLS